MLKKITFVMALFLLVGVIGAFAQNSFTVDLSNLPVRGGMTPAARGGANYGFYKIDFPDGTFPANLPWADYNRVRVVFKYYRANGNEIRQGNGNAMVVILYDANGAYEENDTGPGPNTPIKVFNVGGANGNVRISSEAGAPIRPLSRAPGAILLQRQGNPAVAEIELVELTFFKGN